MSPTKVVTAVEGGLVTTDNRALADTLRAMRDYGKDPEHPEEMAYLGLSARMSELHAAVALLSLRRMEELVKARQERIARYRERLGNLPGCRVQEFPGDRTSSGNYFVLFISESARKTRDEVYAALKTEGIQTKRYFFPPVHLHSLFRNYPMRVSVRMGNSLRASHEGLALPLYSHMAEGQQNHVMLAVEALLG
jgi:dTDP-4-amino-4,6-dideoxygalactose transaminase